MGQQTRALANRQTVTSEGDLQSTFVVSSATDITATAANPFVIYYNTTTGELKYSSFGSWSTGSNLGTARNYLAGAGTQDAGLAFGGVGGSGVTAATEEYNGTTWTGGGNMNLARPKLAGAGSQSAGLAFGGSFGGNSGATEEYDGSAWSSGGSLNIARQNLAGAGTQTAGLAAGGLGSNATEEYDGTVWSSGGNMNTARGALAGAGTQTAGLAFGGFTGSITAATEEYDGSAWAAGGNLGTARRYLAGAGTQSAGLAIAGQSAGFVDSNLSEEYNGSAWAAGGNMNIARQQLAGAGTQTAGLGFGGYASQYLATTEEYSGTLTATVAAAPPLSPTYTLGVDFFNPAGYVSQWFDVSVDLYNVVPALKAELDALGVGDTFLLNGSVTATVVLNNGESDIGGGVRNYWINASPNRDPGQELNITSISFPS